MDMQFFKVMYTAGENNGKNFKALLDFEAVMKFKEENPYGIGFNKISYEIKPMTDEEVLRENSKSYEQKLQDFKSTLSPSQKNDIEIGCKKIEYKKNLGFHLVVCGIDEDDVEERSVNLLYQRKGGFISTAMPSVKREEDVKVVVRGALKNKKDEIFDLLVNAYPAFTITREEFDNEFLKITRL